MGEIRSAILWTDTPYPSRSYTWWYDIYDKDIENGYYTPIGTKTILDKVPSYYVKEHFSRKELLKEQRKLKLNNIYENSINR